MAQGGSESRKAPSKRAEGGGAEFGLEGVVFLLRARVCVCVCVCVCACVVSYCLVFWLMCVFSLVFCSCDVYIFVFFSHLFTLGTCIMILV